MEYAFVTGATGLLGNNVVRALLKRNIKVKALVRSVEKAKKQFGSLPVEFVEGDMLNVEPSPMPCKGVMPCFIRRPISATVTKAGNIGKNCMTPM